VYSGNRLYYVFFDMVYDFIRRGAKTAGYNDIARIIKKAKDTITGGTAGFVESVGDGLTKTQQVVQVMMGSATPIVELLVSNAIKAHLATIFPLLVAAKQVLDTIANVITKILIFAGTFASKESFCYFQVTYSESIPAMDEFVHLFNPGAPKFHTLSLTR